MAEGEENRAINGMNFSPKDLLQRLISKKRKSEEPDIEEEIEGIELSLGLSLNGRFGVDPKGPKKVIRTSSISDFMLTGDVLNAPVAAYAPALVRTCSLPAEIEEEWRKRKEMQSLRRMEAKRKRSEKLRNARTRQGHLNSEDNCEENNGGNRVQSQRRSSVVAINGGKGELLLRYGSGNWAAGYGLEPKFEREKGLQGLLPPNGSTGSGSSGSSEIENLSLQGTDRCNEAVTPSSVQSLPQQNEQKTATPAVTPVANESKKVALNEEGAKEATTNMMLNMPCVSTRGYGPGEKRIEGFLYRYRKGEEVKIVCVCHGQFLTPAEFVKHAGGGDVAHPLRHIVINPSPMLQS